MKLLVPMLLLCSLATGQNPVASEKPVTPKVEPASTQQDGKKHEPAPAGEKKGENQEAKANQDPAKVKPATDKPATADQKPPANEPKIDRPASDAPMPRGTDPADIATYTFNKHVIQHRFCKTCGVQPYGEGVDPKGNRMVAVNIRCVDNVDTDKIPVQHFNGRDM